MPVIRGGIRSNRCAWFSDELNSSVVLQILLVKNLIVSVKKRYKLYTKKGRKSMIYSL